MNTVRTDPAPQWLAAFEDLDAPRSGRSMNWLVFLEDREDLTVHHATDAGLDSTQTRQRGVSARSAVENPRWAYLSDPGPDDVSSVLDAALDPSRRPPSRRGDSPGLLGGLDAVSAAASVTRLESVARRAMPRARIAVRWVEFEQSVVIGRPDRPPVTDHRRGARVRLEIRLPSAAEEVVAVGEAVLRDPPGGHGTELDRLAQRVAARVEKRIAVRDAPTGPQAVVFAPGVGGVLVHELVGHALEGDIAASGSWLSGRREAVASSAVAVVDDPRRSRAPWEHDDEGERARATALVLDGRVRGRLLDRASAAACGKSSTGHGRCASFREPIRPRMGCTFLGAGPSFPAEVLDGVDGVYVRRMESAWAEPKTGRATFRVSDADLLNDGRRVGALRPFLLRVDGESALSTLDRVGNDLAFDTCIGSCHRDGQALSTSVGAPTFRIGVASVVA